MFHIEHMGSIPRTTSLEQSGHRFRIDVRMLTSSRIVFQMEALELDELLKAEPAERHTFA